MLDDMYDIILRAVIVMFLFCDMPVCRGSENDFVPPYGCLNKVSGPHDTPRPIPAQHLVRIQFQ